jgi:hypothetical protein
MQPARGSIEDGISSKDLLNNTIIFTYELGDLIKAKDPLGTLD